MKQSQFLQAQTGAFLTSLADDPLGSLYDASQTFRHFRWTYSVDETLLDIYTLNCSIEQCVFDKTQGIYRLWTIQNLVDPQQGNKIIQSFWQEYCSADLITWVFNRTYKINSIPIITRIYSTFIDVANRYGFGSKTRVIQVYDNQGNLYNAYAPALGLCPVSDNVVASPVLYVDPTTNRYIDVQVSTVSGTPTTTIVPWTSSTTFDPIPVSGDVPSKALVNGRLMNYARYVDSSGVVNHGIVYNDGTLKVAPITDSSGKLYASIAGIPLSGIEMSTREDDTNTFLTVLSADSYNLPRLGIPKLLALGTVEWNVTFPDTLYSSFAQSQDFKAVTLKPGDTTTFTIQNEGEQGDGYVRLLAGYTTIGYSYVLSMTVSNNSADGLSIQLPSDQDLAASVYTGANGKIILSADGVLVDLLESELVGSIQQVTQSLSNQKLVITNNSSASVTISSATIHYD